MTNENELKINMEDIESEQVGNIEKRPIKDSLKQSIYRSDVYSLLKMAHNEELRERVDKSVREIIERIDNRLNGLPHNIRELLPIESRVLYPPRLELVLKEGYWLGTFEAVVQRVSKFDDLKDDFERKYSEPLKHLAGQYCGFVPLEFRDEPPITDVIQVDHRQESLRGVGFVIVPLDAIKSYKIIGREQEFLDQ
jgi:hypothetical protein